MLIIFCNAGTSFWLWFVYLPASHRALKSAEERKKEGKQHLHRQLKEKLCWRLCGVSVSCVSSFFGLDSCNIKTLMITCHTVDLQPLLWIAKIGLNPRLTQHFWVQFLCFLKKNKNTFSINSNVFFSLSTVLLLFLRLNSLHLLLKLFIDICFSD